MPTEDGQQQLGRKLSELLENYREDDPKELLKYRFFCREGVFGLYGQTGIGKSSFLMQCLILWSLGREAFGMIPRQAIKSLLIQAENDDGDIAEMCKGVCEGLKLTPEETKLACENIIVIQEDSKCGSEFFNSVVKPALEENRPDLLCIDCALSYLGGDAISQEVVSKFLRTDLKPLLREYQCGCIVVHHTNKTGSSDNAYAGSGSAEWANMPRAVLVLLAAGKSTFKLIAAKRGTRLQWSMPDGETPTLEKRLKHSNVKGRIFWEETDAVDCDESKTIVKKQDQETEILQRVPPDGTIETKELVKVISENKIMGINTAKRVIAKMISSGKLFLVPFPRSNARAEIHVSRSPPAIPDTIKQA